MCLKIIHFFCSVTSLFFYFFIIFILFLLNEYNIISIPTIYNSDIIHIIFDFLVYIFPLITLFARLCSLKHIKNLTRFSLIYINILLISDFFYFSTLDLIGVLFWSGVSIFSAHFLCTLYILLDKVLNWGKGLFLIIMSLIYFMLFLQLNHIFNKI